MAEVARRHLQGDQVVAASLHGTSMTPQQVEAHSKKRRVPAQAWPGCVMLLAKLPDLPEQDRSKMFTDWALGMLHDSQASHMNICLGPDILRLERQGGQRLPLFHGT